MFIDRVPDSTGAVSSVPYDPGTESNYKFISKFGDEVNMSRRVGNQLHVPRQTMHVGHHDYRVIKDKQVIDCDFEPVNDEQQPLANKSVTLLQNGVSHVFEAPTGWGKSVVGAYIACQVGQPTMIVVTKTDLMDSWRDALINVLGIPAKLIGTVQQDTCDWKGKRFVIGMVHSLIIPDRYPAEMYTYFGLMILDEVHVMAADCFVNCCWMFPAKLRLGFSATPDRSDGKWRMVEGHVGNVLVRGTMVPMTPKVLVKKTGWKIPKHVYHAPGRMMGVSKAMSTDTQRNSIIVDFVLSAFNKDRRPLVMADTIDHLDRLFQMFTSAGISGENIGYYVGGMSKIELKITKSKPIVLATYAMCSTGTNVPHWDCMVMATPRSNIKQSIGRVLRYVEHKRQPVILDLLDGDKILNGFYLSRLKQYYAVKAEIKQM